MIKVNYLTPFELRYQRNNKRTGQKNLRCFPQCNTAGHMASGFCGLPITCEVSGITQDMKGVVFVKAWGEFVQCGEDPKFKWQSKHGEEGFKRLERTRAAPTLPYLKGDVTKLSENTYQVSFNSQLLGWHYHWVSTKHTCDAFHSFRAYIFFEQAAEQHGSLPSLTYLGYGDSPRFQLYSRRRQRGATAASEKRPLKKEDKPPSKRLHSATPQSSDQEATPRWGIQMPGKMDVKIESALDLLKIGADKVNRSVKGALWTSLLASDYQKTSSPPKFTTVQSFLLRHLANLSLEQKINHCLTSGRMMLFMLQYNAGSHPVKNLLEGSDLPDANVKEAGQTSSDGLGGPGQFDEIVWDNLADILGPSIPDMDAIFDAKPTSSRRHNKLAPDLPDLGDIRAEVKKEGDAALIRDLEATFNFASKVSEFLLEEREISDELNEVFAAMATPENVGKLAKQIKHEEAWLRETPLDRNLELESYDKMLKDLVNGTMPETFCEQVRIIVFRRVLHFHFASKIVPGTFQRPMEFAAKRRFIPVDPEVTPTKYVAAFVRMQLSDPADGFADLQDVCTEDGKFKTKNQQLRWQRATYCLKRKQLRYGIVQRVKKELYSKKARAASLSQSIMSPVHPSIDLNGSWARVENSENITNYIMKSLDMTYGTLPAKLVEVMFSKVKLTISQKSFFIQGEKKMLTDSSLLFHLDGSFHHFNVPAPFPMPSKLYYRKYCAWIEADSSGSSVLRVVAGTFNSSSGLEAGKRTVKDLFAARIGVSPDSEELKMMEEKSIVLAFQLRLSTDRMTFDVTTSSFAFLPTDKHIPASNSKNDVIPLFLDEDILKSWASHIKTHHMRYYKVLDDSAGMEDLFKLLQ